MQLIFRTYSGKEIYSRVYTVEYFYRQEQLEAEKEGRKVSRARVIARCCSQIEKCKNVLEHVTNTKDLFQIKTNLGGLSTVGKADVEIIDLVDLNEFEADLNDFETDKAEFEYFEYEDD